MSFNYLASRDTAQRLIENFGQSAALRKSTRSGPEHAPSFTSADFPIVVVDLNTVEKNGPGAIGRTMRTLYVGAVGITVSVEKADKIVIGSLVHEIVEVRSLSPGGTLVMWEVDLAV